MGKAVTISPNSSKLTPQTVRRSGYKFRERQPPCIKQALIGHKKSPLFIRANNRDSPDRTLGVNFYMGKCRIKIFKKKKKTLIKVY